MNDDQAIGLSLENIAGGRFDVTDQLWPRYQRESAAIGGDLAARSTFDATINEANKWLMRLNWRLYESYGGVLTFLGKLSKVTADLYGSVVSVNLREVYNSIIVVYQKTVGGSDNQTSPVSDPVSIARYGFKELIYKSDIILSDSDANLVRDGLLIRLANPKIKAEQLRSARSGAVSVSLEFDGMVRKLEDQSYMQTTGSALDADQAIILSMAASTEVFIGRIESNSLQVSRRSPLTDIWSRIRDIAELGDGLGNFWAIGCYASDKLDYYKPDLNIISYYAELDRNNKLVYFDSGGRLLPPALIKPARLVWRRDLLAGHPPASPLTDDIRAMITGSIRFSKDSIQITSLKNDDNASLQAIVNGLN